MFGGGVVSEKAVITHSGDAPVKSSENILQEADRLTAGEKRAAYGKVNKQLRVLADLWTVVIGTPITPLQVALCLLQLKVSREMHKHSRDNIVDMAGYARVIELLYDGE